MIISKTPLRISFVGGGTDFEDFYRKYPGRVLSVSIDKYVYITLNPKFDNRLRISYSKTENVDHRDKLKHSRVKAALEELEIEKGLEITSIADVHSTGTGLGSSSSYTVGLLNCLHAFLDKPLNPQELAEKACHIAINKINCPIGKQDQYIASFGGLNLITFNCNGKIKVEPIHLAKKIKDDFQNHLLLFYTGIKRSSDYILSEQKDNVEKKIDFLKKMSEIVPVFKENLERGNFDKLGELLHQNWLMKKELSSKISNFKIEKMYRLALEAGAWGGKILGAGGGGFLLVIASPKKHEEIKKALKKYRLMPFRFTEEGSKIIFKN